MNKSIVTNGVAITVVIIAYLLHNPLLISIGLFSLSGAITNWLAIHMLFEKVPGLYGSGVIPARFEDFKRSIRELMMTQFFTAENIERFLNNPEASKDFHLGAVIEKIDLSPAYDSLVKVIMASSFGDMLGMMGGQDALIPLKEPFLASMKISLVNITKEESFQKLLREELEQPDTLADIKQQIEAIVEKRLDELTPGLVKDIIQTMIKKHLGWLVVWGGVFGGLIGLVAGLVGY